MVNTAAKEGKSKTTTARRSSEVAKEVVDQALHEHAMLLQETMSENERKRLEEEERIRERALASVAKKDEADVAVLGRSNMEKMLKGDDIDTEMVLLDIKEVLERKEEAMYAKGHRRRSLDIERGLFSDGSSGSDLKWSGYGDSTLTDAAHHALDNLRNTKPKPSKPVQNNEQSTAPVLSRIPSINSTSSSSGSRSGGSSSSSIGVPRGGKLMTIEVVTKYERRKDKGIRKTDATKTGSSNSSSSSSNASSTPTVDSTSVDSTPTLSSTQPLPSLSRLSSRGIDEVASVASIPSFTLANSISSGIDSCALPPMFASVTRYIPLREAPTATELMDQEVEARVAKLIKAEELRIEKQRFQKLRDGLPT